MKRPAKDKLTRAAERGLAEAKRDFDVQSGKAQLRAIQTRRPRDFSTAIGSFRAWPDGAVTRLDTDGDSVGTVVEGARTLICFLASPALANALRARLNSGLYGARIEEVAERLLCEAVRR